MKFGYVRISTDDQNEALQVDALQAAGCEKIFIDKGVSGSVAPSSRPQFRKLVKALSCGDVVAVWKLDRLGRSLSSMIATLDAFKAQGVEFQSLTESIDTNTPHGRAMWQMIGVFAELERETILARSREGVAAARRRGVTFGRPRKLDDDDLDLARRLIDRKEESVSSMARRLKVDRRTLGRALNARGGNA